MGHTVLFGPPLRAVSKILEASGLGPAHISKVTLLIRQDDILQPDLIEGDFASLQVLHPCPGTHMGHEVLRLRNFWHTNLHLQGGTNDDDGDDDPLTDKTVRY